MNHSTRYASRRMAAYSYKPRRRRNSRKLALRIMRLSTLALLGVMAYLGIRLLLTLSLTRESGTSVQWTLESSALPPSVPQECSSDYLLLVNPWNSLPQDYQVTLTQVPGGELVDSRIYQPLMDMLEAARESNLGALPLVVSGYRTQETQQEILDQKIEEYLSQGYSYEEAEEQALLLVAKPGYSEHQLGLAVDINGEVYDVYTWLMENSYRYGFIFRYPGEKTDLTGISQEVWHYRYVGVEAATEMYEQGLCLEEYLDCQNNTDYAA